jgi:hypothetical protein
VTHAALAALTRPANGAYRRTFGVALYRAGKPREAVKELEEALRLTGGRSSYDLYVLALCRHALGDPAGAGECFGRAEERFRDDGPTLTDGSERRALEEARAEVARVLRPRAADGG